MADPGWYPDPSGAPQLRWYNGSGWTENTAPYAAPTPATAPQVARQPAAGYPATPAPTIQQAQQFYSPAASPTVSKDPGSAPRRGLVLGVISAILAVLTIFFGLLGGTVYALNWLLWVALVVLALPATVLGIIGLIQSSIGLSRSVDPQQRRQAGIGLGTSIVGCLSIVLLFVL